MTGISNEMKLLIGLGNTGREYEATRHNVGFWVLDDIAAKQGVEFYFDKKMNGEITEAKIGGKATVLLKPLTFVNKSGEAVKKAKLKYKVKTVDIILIHDDLDIDFGSLKVSFGKHSAGHKGVQSIIDHLKTGKFWRIRIGLANKKLTSARHQKTLSAKKKAVASFVLSKFTPSEKEELKKMVKDIILRLESLQN